jgi:hypothetical protein
MNYTKEQLLDFAKYVSQMSVSPENVESLFTIWEFNSNLGQIPYEAPKGGSNEPTTSFEDMDDKEYAKLLVKGISSYFKEDDGYFKG